MARRRHTLLTAVLAIVFLHGPYAARVARAQRSDRLAPRDVLNVTVVNERELSGKFTIEADGTFMFPLIGRVNAAGLGVHDVEDRLKQMLMGGFVRNPQLSIAVEPYQIDQSISVLGEVRVAGSYPLGGGLTLTELLARAGSTTERAGAVALITRPASGGSGPPASASPPSEVIRVNLRALESGAAENVRLKPGDTVFIPTADKIYVLGAVTAPGAYKFDEHMTVLQALALAGGLTERGSSKRIRVIRQTDAGRQEADIKLHDFLKPSDTVVVRERLF